MIIFVIIIMVVITMVAFSFNKMGPCLVTLTLRLFAGCLVIEMG